MRLTRFSGNPIISPEASHPWECWVTTNPGAWYDAESKRVFLLYRATGSEPEFRIHLGLATSQDGLHFERASDQPAFSPSVDGFDGGCVEDARIVKFDDWYYVTYATRPFPPGYYWLPVEQRPYQHPIFPADFPWILRTNETSTGLALTRDFRNWIRAGRITPLTVDDRDVLLFPEKIGDKFYMIHRPKNWVGPFCGTEHPAMWIAAAEDLLGWGESRLLAKGERAWESTKIGGNTPPMRTEQGWLLLYHGVGEDCHYRLGAMLLDLEDPSVVRYRSRDWILQPEEPYELNGYYPGCVFPCGKVVLGDTLYVYYGGADKYVGVATCPLAELIDYLLTCPVS